MSDTRTLIQQCTNVLLGHGASGASMKTQLESLAGSVDESALADVYGEGEYLASFESEVAVPFITNPSLRSVRCSTAFMCLSTKILVAFAGVC